MRYRSYIISQHVYHLSDPLICFISEKYNGIWHLFLAVIKSGSKIYSDEEKKYYDI